MTPVWVFCIDNLQILAANRAALSWLGYEAATLHSMTIADIRLPTDRQRIADEVARFKGQTTDAGTWTIIGCSGEHFSAHFSWVKVHFSEREAIVATVHEVNELHSSKVFPVDRGVQHKEVNYAESKAQDTEISIDDLPHVFNAVPGKLLVVTPYEYRVVAVTDEYAQAVMLKRDALVGKYLFEVFPDNPDGLDSDGAANLRASFHRVEALRATDFMRLQRYPVRRPDGTFEERYWLPTNKPVLDDRGQVSLIVHRVEDVTSAYSIDDRPPPPGAVAPVDSSPDIAKARSTLFALQERETRLRTAETLLSLGSWEHDIGSGALTWSDRVFEIYGVSADLPIPDFDTYVELVHPDDREEMVSNYKYFVESGAQELHFQHRIIRADGKIAHVDGIGTRHLVDDKELIIGFVQDVTHFVMAEDKLREEAKRRQLASRMVRLGTWRYDVGQDFVIWDDEVAAIHEEPAGTRPTVDDGIGYYIPEHRERVRSLFDACVKQGFSFDEVFQIITAKGRAAWIRAIGEAIRDENGTIVTVEGAFQDVSDLIQERSKATELSERLRITLDGMNDGFYILDKEWKFAYVNRAAERFLQKSRKSLIGKVASDVFPKGIRNVIKKYNRAIDEGKMVRFVDFYSPLHRWLEITAQPTDQGLAVYFRDITEERARAEQLRLLEAATARLNDILLITDGEPIDGPNGPRIVYVNDAFERRTGFSREEAIGKTPRILQGPKTQRDQLDRIRQALIDWEPVRAELINYTKGGEEFWLELDIVPLADETGWYTHWVAVERDITERKQAEEAAKSTAERFGLVTKAAGAAVWECRADEERRWWSNSFEDVFGHPLGEGDLSPDIWRGNLHPDDAPRAVAAFESLVSGKAANSTETYRFRRADGTWAIVEDIGFSIMDAEDGSARILGTLTDVTEKRQLEERLRQAQKMEVVGQLTGGVAHDFNNLLTVILGNAEILEDELSKNPELQELARMCLDAAVRGGELTGQLLAFSRKQPLDPKTIDVSQLISGMDGLLRRTLREDIQIEIVRAGGLWKIDADAAQLESALLNLAVNARDAMPEGGALTIEASNATLDEDYVASEPDLKPGQYVLISVSDTGHGMPADLIEKIFEPFFTTKEVGKGSGLGLSMVFGFIKQSGGHICVYSEVGEGTCFKLYFPRSSNDERPVASLARQKNIARGSETILIVEDDPAVLRYVATQLRSLGYRVHVASSGKEALEVFNRTAAIDMLLTDVVMPGGIGGRELSELVRQIQPSIKVLFTSGYTENSIVHNGILDPGMKLLSKPYRREQLALKVRAVLDE